MLSSTLDMGHATLDSVGTTITQDAHNELLSSAAESTSQQKSWISYSIRSGYAVAYACTCHILRVERCRLQCGIQKYLCVWVQCRQLRTQHYMRRYRTVVSAFFTYMRFCHWWAKQLRIRRRNDH